MDETLNTDELRARIEDKREDIISRVEALQDEVTGLYDSVVETVRRKPMVILGGTILVGIAIGFFVSSRRNKGHGKLGRAHAGLVSAYADAVAEHVETAVSKGHNTADAVRDALRGRAPVVVIQGSEGEEPTGGFLRQSIKLAMTSALGYASRALVDHLSSRISLDRYLGQVDGEEMA